MNELREVIVANNKTQRKYKFETTATTLAELKRDMEAQGIDYSGMSFTEGISKTQLMEDNSLLPTNLIYKGQRTNNLVILLTNTQKNIASGAMSRKEMYAIIKDNNCADIIKEDFGDNYTRITNVELEEWLEDEGYINNIDENSNNESGEDSEENPIVKLVIDTIKYYLDIDVLNTADILVIAEKIKEVAANAEKRVITDAEVDAMMKDIL